MSKVLITGSSKGFGFLIANSLLQKGHVVVASMRNVEGRNKNPAQELQKAGAHVIEMDVTDETSVQKGATKAIELAGGIDVAINNAGIGVLGQQEAFTTDDFKKLFEVNLFGVQRVNRAVIPFMREQRSGLLIHISSLLGRMTIPFFGPYNASKFALEALADNYRLELSSFGIESVIVEPGAYGTDFVESLLYPSDKTRIKAYGEFASAPEAQMEGFAKVFEGPNAPNPQWVADAIVHLLDTPRGKRPFRTVVDRLGMGAAIEPYNQSIDEIQRNILGAFGMGDALKLKM